MDRFGGDFGAFDAGRDADDGADDAAYDAPCDQGAHSNPPPSPVGQDERRMQVRAYNHWSSLLGDENLPCIEDLEPDFLGDFGPYSILLDFSTGSGTPTVQFIGKELRRECRIHDEVETLADIPADSVLNKIAETYLEVVAAEGPVSFEAESMNVAGHTVAYRGILLPYSSDLDTIDFVYAVINWKEVADAKTADALLAEIDRAMDRDGSLDRPVVESEPAPTAEIIRFGAQAEPEPAEADHADDGDPWASDDNILDLRSAAFSGIEELDDLPAPSFGREEQPEESFETDDTQFEQPADVVAEESVTEETPAAPKRNRQVDALGNPVGGAPAADDHTPSEAPGGITTAADYGLPEWDDEEPEGEDVDEVVNPLADIDLNSRLLSLVNAGTRGKKTVDLATLSGVESKDEEDEEEGASFDRKLFRPKAPSVDTLLSPEPYEEEAEDEYEVEAYYPAEEQIETEEAIEQPEEFDALDHEPAADAYADFGSFDEMEEAGNEHATDEEVADDTVATEDAIEEAVEHETTTEIVELDVEAEEEAFELGEDLEIAETTEETVSEHAEAVAEPEVEEAYELVDEIVEEPPVLEAEDDILELAEVAEVEETFEEETSTDLVPAEETAPDSESLTGLLAAVRDLTEAARKTDDPSRRALYEAVGKAFDVSIKAVIASEHQARSPQSVIEHLPVDAVAPTGPDMALVMVRRHVNGDTEVLGEVPHDSILMESAQRKLASGG